MTQNKKYVPTDFQAPRPYLINQQVNMILLLSHWQNLLRKRSYHPSTPLKIQLLLPKIDLDQAANGNHGYHSVTFCNGLYSVQEPQGSLHIKLIITPSCLLTSTNLILYTSTLDSHLKVFQQDTSGLFIYLISYLEKMQEEIKQPIQICVGMLKYLQHNHPIHA